MSVYYLDALIPAWLAHDPGYLAALRQHLLDRMALNEYQPVGEVRTGPAPSQVPPPPGMALLRATVEVAEFDIEMGDDGRPGPGWLAVQTDASTVHSVPLDDEIVHEFTGACPCGPTPRATPCADGSEGRIVTHHSLDGRELGEPGYRAPLE